jgi:hypothetical protein
MDAVENEFLTLERDGDRGMSPINEDVLIEPIAVNVAKGFLGTACRENKLELQKLFVNVYEAEDTLDCRCAIPEE